MTCLQSHIRNPAQRSRTLESGLIFLACLAGLWSTAYANPLDDLDAAEKQIERENATAESTRKPGSQPTTNRSNKRPKHRKVKPQRAGKHIKRKPRRSRVRAFRLSEAQWRRRLSSEQYRVLRQKGTERKNSGAYLHNKRRGIYLCAACGHKLYASRAKFDSGTGWPSFSKALKNGIRRKPDHSHGMRRTEIVCARCNSHLGHVFNDGPKPSGERHCVNSISLEFKSKPRR